MALACAQMHGTTKHEDEQRFGICRQNYIHYDRTMKYKVVWGVDMCMYEYIL
jgi:hypothetical protein